LTFGPSPIRPLDRFGTHLGGARIWAKREDCNSGLDYGGNKIRNLEYLVQDVLAQGAGTLMLIGGYQSNHTRHVGEVAARLGRKCLLLQEKWVDSPDPMNDRVGNIMLSRIMDAEVRLDPPASTSVFAGSATRLRATARPQTATAHPRRRLPAQRAAVRSAWPTSTSAVLTSPGYVDNGPHLALWDRLPTVAFWLLSAAIGVPIIARAIKRPINRSAAPDHSARS
jgi:hypothetical protein